MSALAELRRLYDDRPRVAVAAAATLLVLLAYPLVDLRLRANGIAPPFRFWDFGAYGGAVERWLSGEPIYVQNENGGYHGSYLYPPVILILFRPFLDVFAFKEAAMAWELTSVLLLWLGLQAVVATYDVDLRLHERGVLLWALVGFQPLLLSVKMGQAAGFLTAMLCFALAALHRGGTDAEPAGRPWRAVSGAATALVGTFKFAYAPIGAHLLTSRERLLAALATGAGLVVFSVVGFGIEVHRSYLDVLAWGINSGRTPRTPVLWMAPYFKPLYSVPGGVALRLAASGLLAGLALLAPDDAGTETFAMGVAAAPLLAPKAYTYSLTLALPAAVALFALELGRERDGHPIAVLAGLLCLQFHAYGLKYIGEVVPEFMARGPLVGQVVGLLQPGLWGTLLLAGLATLRVAQAGDVDELLR